MFAGPTGPDGLHVPSFVEGDCCRSNTAQADPGVAGPEAFAALTFSLIAVGGLTVVLLRHRASAAQAAAGDLAPRRGGFGCRIVKSSRLRGRNLTRARQVAASATRRHGPLGPWRGMKCFRGAARAWSPPFHGACARPRRDWRGDRGMRIVAESTQLRIFLHLLPPRAAVGTSKEGGR